MDDTVKQICLPGEMQRTVCNGHKRIHAIKFQAIATPNGLVANLYGPVEGKRHDSRMLADSAILPLLQQYSVNQIGNQLCIYGNLTYPLRPQLQTSFSNPQLNPQKLHITLPLVKQELVLSGYFETLQTFLNFLTSKITLN